MSAYRVTADGKSQLMGLLCCLFLYRLVLCCHAHMLPALKMPTPHSAAHAAQAAEAAWFEREGALRREVLQQEERLRSLEAQKAELAAASADGTRPLLRCAAPLSSPPSLAAGQRCGLRHQSGRCSALTVKQRPQLWRRPDAHTLPSGP